MRKVSFASTSALYTAALAGAIMMASAPAAAQTTADDSGATQTTDDQQQSSVPQTELPVDQAEEGSPAIVVTGSRIRTVTPFNSPDPISVIDPELAMKQGKQDLASILQSSPIAAGSTQITSAISSNFVTAGGPGSQTIDLRGLGPNRTLVLLNGRRAGPAGTRGSVSAFDLNVLPASIAANVQILKTGASSVYGSDAIAGVVNIITKRDTDGLELNFNTSVPFDSGGEEYRLSAIWGKTFSRGHILIAGDYSHTNELTRGDRSYLACPEAYTFREDGSRADLIDPRTGKYHCEDLPWGHVWTYNLIDNLRLDGPGGPNTGPNTSPNGETVLLQYQYPGEHLGIPTYGAPSNPFDFGAPPGWYPVGYTTETLAVQNQYHPFVEQQSIIPKTDLYTIYADGSYEVLDSIEMFGEFLYNRRETYQNGWRQFWNFGYTGDLYGTGFGTIWGDGFTGVNLLSPTAITDLADNSQKVDYYRGVGGLRGDVDSDGFMSGWHWEIYGQYSRSIGRYRSQQILQDVYDSGYFQSASCVGTTLPYSGKQCMDLPWADPYFLRGELTPAQADYLTDWEEGKTVYSQLTGEATVSGELLQLPAGPLGVAIGATIRRDRINDRPGSITFSENPYYDPTIDPSDDACDEIGVAPIDQRHPCDQYHGNAWGTTTSGITAGKSVTKEAFGELNIPVLKDIPAIKEFTLSVAGRVTNVTSTRKSDGASASDNGNWTYKIGANWAVTDWLRFRGSYGTSFRAPALFELFLADETSFPSARTIDPCVQSGQNLALGNITQRVFDNCAADGIPNNYAGGAITATAISQGGLGQVHSETSKALVLGTILTPRFDFLPNTQINVAIDYFDIKVNGEITQLGPGSIIYNCYDSENYPNDPLCSLFTRARDVNPKPADPYAITEVRDQYVNIASQENEGVDVSIDMFHDFGSAGMLTFKGDMTWQTKDTFKLLPTSPTTSDNGEAGSPQWIGDFKLYWENAGQDLTVFYGLDVIGGTSDVQDFLDDNGGDLCINSVLRGRYCPDLTASATFYHSISVTKDIDDAYSLTLGVSNLFDTRPPRVSVLNGSEISMLGPVILASQYSFVGRRAFINVSAKF